MNWVLNKRGLNSHLALRNHHPFLGLSSWVPCEICVGFSFSFCFSFVMCSVVLSNGIDASLFLFFPFFESINIPNCNKTSIAKGFKVK